MSSKKLFVMTTDKKHLFRELDVTYIVRDKDIEYAQKVLQGKTFYVNLPYVTRDKDIIQINDVLYRVTNIPEIEGVVFHNFETLQMIKKSGFTKKIIAGPGIYVWNNATYEKIKNEVDDFIVSYELNEHEKSDINHENFIMPVYGRTPVMITANCIQKINSGCSYGEKGLWGGLKDRKGMIMPVMFECDYCYNVTFNAVATSLHDPIINNEINNDKMLLSFTVEDGKEVEEIIKYFLEITDGKTPKCPISVFSKTFYNHGVD